jgi:hypothetical protein
VSDWKSDTAGWKPALPVRFALSACSAFPRRSRTTTPDVPGRIPGTAGWKPDLPGAPRTDRTETVNHSRETQSKRSVEGSAFSDINQRV